MKNFILASAIVCLSASACHSPKAAATAETAPAPVTAAEPAPSPSTVHHQPVAHKHHTMK
jgi:hypothetical protein